jgi:uncharacterized protein
MLVPKVGRARIDALDVLRGIAIMLIFVLNIPLMGNTFYLFHADPRLLGWSPADQLCWWFQSIALAGTQRGILQLLFGAGAVILLERTMRPDGPVEVADLYFRRTLWLMAFGLVDIFALFWIGDILLIYSIAALFLFPFRRLGPRTLITLALLCLLIPTARGVVAYQKGERLQAAATQATQKQAQGKPLDDSDRGALATRAEQLAQYHPSAAPLAEERAARSGSSIAAYQHWLSSFFLDKLLVAFYPTFILEAFSTMLLGMGLFKLGILQGDRTPRFYLALALLAYIPGLATRALGCWQQADFQASHIGMFTGPLSRVAVTLGHVAAINLLLKGRVGQALLAPFKAVGRTAFSLYLMQNFLGMWVLFPGFGLGLWGRFGWSSLAMIAFGVMAAQVVLANLWVRAFGVGPMEWAWRSLAYLKIQPFRHRPVEPVETGTLAQV